MQHFFGVLSKCFKETAEASEENQTWSNFTPRALQIFVLAREEACRLHCNEVADTEHILLGLIKFGRGVAINALQNMGLNLQKLRAELEQNACMVSVSESANNASFTPRVNTAVALARHEAKLFGHTYIGTEHLLLGLLQEGEGVAAKVLNSCGVDVNRCRVEILKELDPNIQVKA